MENSKDTGLRVTSNGTLKVKKSVFYARDEVRRIISKMKESSAYPSISK